MKPSEENRELKIAILGGDGIGPEVVGEAVRVLKAIATRYELKFELDYGLIGGQALEETGRSLPMETLRLCKKSDCVLLGPVGGSRWERAGGAEHPKFAILELHSWLGVFANVRPIRLHPPLVDASPLKPERIRNLDVVLVREISSGIYYGHPRGIEVRGHRRVSTDTMTHSELEIERIARQAFDLADRRRRKLASVAMPKLMENGRLWREIVDGMAADYPEVELADLDSDTAALRLLIAPHDFDVIVTDGYTGDILGAEIAALTGTYGMHPSADLGGKTAIFAPGHGSAPDISERGIANPSGAIMAAAMMLETCLGRSDAAEAIRRAVNTALENGFRTRDLVVAHQRPASTQEFTDKVIEGLV